jgi:hypothetical protein
VSEERNLLSGWVMFLYFTVRLFRPPVHTVWYGVLDVGGFFVMVWTLLTRSTWQHVALDLSKK